MRYENRMLKWVGRSGLNKQNIIKAWLADWQEAWYCRPQAAFELDLSFTEMIKHFPERNTVYAYAVYYYAHRIPMCLREHRAYFKRNLRGFGEDAFYAMWWLLLKEYKPEKMLEIGVYRGQVISLWSLISKYLHRSCEVHGISPFSSLGDSVSSYDNNLDYEGDIHETFNYWKLQPPVLLKSLSTDPEAVTHIQSQSWDMIYIDGSHEFEIALKDYKLCLENLRTDGILILDDASLNTDYKPPSFSFAGHPGPSQVAREYADKEMEFLGAVGHNNVFRKR